MWKRRRSGLIVPGGRRRFLIGAAAGIAAPLIVRPASAMLIVNQLAGFGGGGTPPPPSISYRTHKINADGSTSFANVDIGTAPSAGETRHVIIGICTSTGGAVPTFSDVTIGGIAATAVVTQAASVRSRVSLYIAEVPTGTTATIAFTASGNAVNADVAVWAAYNLTSATAVDTASSASDPAALNMDVQSGDVLVGFAGANSSSNPTTTWTGMTERLDTLVGTTGIGSRRASAADHTATASETRTISADFDPVSGSPSWSIGVAAAFR